MANRKILVVDDDEMMCMLTSNILSKSYDVVCALSGKEGIEKYASEKPDLILSDLMMPEMSGFEMMEKLRESYDVLIPFVFMTANSSDDSEKQGFESGAVDYIRKPFKADILLHRIDNIFSNIEEINGLQKAARIEPMTGLFNKTTTAEEINAAIPSSGGMFMMIDLDSFKLVNDIYGHDAGDKLLIWFAKTLKNTMRSKDVVGRIGGDEFVAFCMNTHDEQVVSQRCEFLNKKIVEYCIKNLGEDMNIPIGISIGAVTCPDEGGDYQTLYKKADQALYTVKRSGKHNYSIYKQAVQKQEYKESSSLEDICMILGERENSRGAYVVSEDGFGQIYKFLMRFQKNYTWNVHMLAFTINEKESGDGSSEGAESFIASSASCLRVSDVLTHYGQNMVLILFLNTTEENYTIPVDRIMEKWNTLKESDKYDITYETAFLQSF